MNAIAIFGILVVVVVAVCLVTAGNDVKPSSTAIFGVLVILSFAACFITEGSALGKLIALIIAFCYWGWATWLWVKDSW